MQYFVIESVFQKPFESFGEAVPRHRSYLQGWFDQGVLLCSGPKSDRSGGILIGRADNPAQIDALLTGDPYCQEGLAVYSVRTFDATKRHPVLEEF